MGRDSSESLRPLLEAPGSLSELVLATYAVSPSGLRAIIQSPLFANVTRLGLLGQMPQNVRAAVEWLAAVQHTCRLRVLAFRGGGLSRDALPLACGLPPSLRVLDVSHSHINSTAAREFAGAKAASALRVLTMNANGIGNDGAAALFTSPHLAGLKVLNLSYCQVGDDALRTLLDNSPLADGLNRLDVTGSPASADMKQAVKDRMGDRVRV